MPDMDDINDDFLYNNEREREHEYGVPYGKHSIVVDRVKIESDEYRQLFSLITIDIDKSSVKIKPEIADKIYEYTKEALYENDKSLYESFYLIDINTGKVVGSITDPEEKKEGGVHYPDRIYDVINMAREKGTRLLALHNHPEGYPPSLDDISNICKHGYVASVIAGGNGQLYQAYNYCNKVFSEEQCSAFHDLISRMALQGIDVDRAYNDMYKMLDVGYEIKGGKKYGKYGD